LNFYPSFAYIMTKQTIF